jgi:hypothetical protein
MDPIINWGMDWVWGLPLIVLTVVIHAFGLALISRRVTSALSIARQRPNLPATSIVVMGGTALWATILHAFEGSLWAGAYRYLGALHDNKSAMLYSLGAMTTYGHATLTLTPNWQMMGTLEALNGWILFGLTAAFLFTVMQKAWPHA